MVGSFKTASEIEHFLQNWLMQYINGNLASSGDSRRASRWSPAGSA